MGPRGWARAAVAGVIVAAAWTGSFGRDPSPSAAPPPPPPAPPVPAVPAADGEPWLGLLLGDAVDGGVQIVAIVPDGPADRAGMRDGDLVIRVDGSDVTDRDALRRAVKGVRAGEKLAVSLLRGGEARDVIVVTAARPRNHRLGPPGLFDNWEIPFPSGMDRGPIPGPPGWIDPEVARRAEPRSGVTLAEIPRELRLHYGAPADVGVLVAQVNSRGPAANAGVRVGDVLVRAGATALDGSAAFAEAVFRAGPGAPLSVQGVRSGKAFTVQIRLAVPTTPPELRGLSRERRIERLEAMIESTRRELEELERRLEIEKSQETP